MASDAGAPAVLIHAGAGPLDGDLRAHRDDVRAVLAAAIAHGRELLARGQDAVSVVTACVVMLEDCELFNAGHGSALCADGSVQMSAAVMRGSDRAAGAVAGVRRVSNPIRAAELVLAGPHVLIVGEPADELAREYGLALEANEAFITRRERARHVLGADAAPGAHGTVGAVCLDAAGQLAAATSTGGLSGQPPGRVGDSPLFGAGTWADDRVAVSCTGDGEAFIRVGAAARITALLAAGAPLGDAVGQTLAEVGRLGGLGGLIALGADGQATMQLSAEAMPRGSWRAGEEPSVRIE